MILVRMLTIMVGMLIRMAGVIMILVIMRVIVV